MKKFLSTAAFCTLLLAVCLYVVRPTSSAGEDLAMQLLDLPAPPPRNPLVDETFAKRSDDFYDPTKPPPDDAPIDDLLDYWEVQGRRGALAYKPQPSDRVVGRLLGEVKGDPANLHRILGALPDNKHTANAVKALYDQLSGDEASAASAQGMKHWLRLNSPYFSDDLARSSQRLKDVSGYVDTQNQNSLLALTRHNFEQAKPVVDKLYADTSQPVSQALATWALYRRALETDSSGDIERYRSELMRIVENKSLTNGARDMAYDALVKERDFDGRLDWSISLYEDETLVKMPSFTMLTTLIMYAPADTYVAKMIELLDKKSMLVRSAAARNLLLALEREQDNEKKIVIVKALLPWIADRNWIKDESETRRSIVNSLQMLKIPESVPVLILALDEKVMVEEDDENNRYGYYGNANAAVANAMRALANAANSAAYAANSVSNSATNSPGNPAKPRGKMVAVYPLRSSAITALGNQRDMRAVGPLRRVLPLVEQHEKSSVFRALLLCNGFSVGEQVDAIEESARFGLVLESLTSPDAMANISTDDPDQMMRMRREIAQQLMGQVFGRSDANRANFPQLNNMDEAKIMLAMHLAGLEDPGDPLINAAALRISQVEKKEPAIAKGMRDFVSRWKGRAVQAFILNDLKNNKASYLAIVGLLTARKDIREHQSDLAVDAASGSPMAAGVASCILESNDRYAEIIEKGSAETQISMLACGRLIRAQFPVPRVAKMLKSTDKRLALAAERYLESEDSPEARDAVLALYPDQTKILGATVAFSNGKTGMASLAAVQELFATVHPWFLTPRYSYGYLSQQKENIDERLKKELTADLKLEAIWTYENNFVRIYKDDAVFSWEEDPSRYRERKLSEEEFEGLKESLMRNHAGDLPPFLACRGYCESKQLVMAAKNGGRRVFVAADRQPKFFAELDAIFKDFRSKPAKLRYWLEKDIPGLEILYAEDGKEAETVWKNGADLRIAVRDVKEAEKQDRLRYAAYDEYAEDAPEIETDEISEDAPAAPDIDEDAEASPMFNTLSWMRVESDGSASPSTQPEAVELIPPVDAKGRRITPARWKVTAADVELRVVDGEVSKTVRGKTSKVSSDEFIQPVISANGRWFVAYRDTESSSGLVRVNLLTNKVIPIATGEDNADTTPVAFIPAANRMLLGRENYDHGHDYASPLARLRYDASSFLLLDPETGVVTKAIGEFGPIAQQRFRTLQASAKVNEMWAAMSQKGETKVGRYDTKAFAFRPILTLPKIEFDSMDMWVDESIRKVYFVYNGHLLAIPLDAKPAKS